MKRKFLKLLGCIVLVFVSFNLIITNRSEAVVSQTADFYVNDSAKVLDASLENYIISTNKSLYSQTGAQIVVVTINSLEGEGLEEYANELFRQYGIGDKKKNNGVLMLLSIQDRKSRIEVGYGLEGALNDAKTGRIQDNYMIPYFKEDNWQDGIKNGYNAILSEVEKEYDVTVEGSTSPVKGEDNDTNFSSIAFSFMLITIMIIIPLCNKKVRRVIAVLAGISSVGSLILAMMVGGIWLTIYILSVFVLIASISSGHGGGFYGGGSSFGGGSSGGGSFRRWRFLRWRRLIKKLLKNKNKLKKQLKIKNCNVRINKEKYKGGKKKMNNKSKNKQEKGITLIALVVTIVVLLILAGVSISLVLNNNGVISKAKDAKNQYAEAQTNDEKQLNEVSDWIDTKVGDTTGGGSVTKIDGVPIPDGYYYVGGTKAKGLVISDNVADKELDKGKENVRRDLAGNQWVWVPVETPSNLYTTVAAGVKLSGDTGVKTTKYTNSAIISGKTRVKPGDTSSFREPDIVPESTNGDTDERAKTAGFSSLANMAETMKSDYEEMIASLEKYKGFYIGRYELTANGEKTGATQTDVNWYTLYKNCTTLASGSKVKTRMIWGLQWDATCKWLATSNFDITNSSTWGNYSNNTADGHGSKKNTGFSESWKANNIYDFAGNCTEFTQEAGFTYGRAVRGGSYGDYSYNVPASFRGGISPTKTNSGFGSRPTLYLIP